MAKREKRKVSDVEECRNKIKAILEEYNCSIHSCDDWSGIYMIDNDTQETTAKINPQLGEE